VDQCNDTLIVDNIDFIYELNSLGTTITDKRKREHSMTHTCASVVAEKSRDICGAFLDAKSIAIGSTIRLAYEVNAPKTTFNIFVCIRYLPNFFGVWSLDSLDCSYFG
jgi:hypothetical protein